MSGKNHVKVMHLISQSDFELLQNLKNGKLKNEESIVKENQSDEIKSKINDENFILNKNEEKFEEDRHWEKLGKKLKPILHPPDSTTSNSMLIDEAIEVLPETYKGKARLFLNKLLKEDGISIDKNDVYVESKPLKCGLSDIVDQLLRPKRKLGIDLDLLIGYLTKVNFPRALILNFEALEKLNPNSLPAVAVPDAESLPSLPRPISESSPHPNRRKRKKKNNRSVSDDESSTLFHDPETHLSLSTIREPVVEDPLLLPIHQDGHGGQWLHF